MKIGVLALQGDFREHLEILHSIGVNPVAVKSKEALDIVDGLIIPGGESTTIGKIMKEMGLFDDLKKKIEDGLPVFGTCAGMIVLAKNISGFPDQVRLEAIDITVERNSYG
ncbi:MAG TPA: pyridoxal 5'-phosphate synthase glutaminase subunit PdxT, partial [Thermotoga sp.]|nr:pyridoxal 5'-phosphate synthase glutaminase subunit PdxT [Thermotoga sp.]